MTRNDANDEETSEDSEAGLMQRAIAQSEKEDMRKLEKIFHAQDMKYRLMERIGEGTFSTVYKAQDLRHDVYNNDSWDQDASESEQWQWTTNAKGEKHKQAQPQFIAVKKIYVTSSPLRIQNELELLHDLSGSTAVCPLITAFRHHDQVVAVLPFFPHQDFRSYYRSMTVYDIKVYAQCLLKALCAVHKRGIIHRDVKPTNFLYDIEKGQGVLVDFGLAERVGTDSSHCLCQESSANRRAKIQNSWAFNSDTPNGYPKNDSRPSRRANRAGTRGFRAPEVLFKCTAQTTKIDIWSVGVILLSILAQRFPFFNSSDDADALIEIASIFGKVRMKQCAMLHGAIFDCSLNTVGEKGHSLARIVDWSTSIARPEDEQLQPDVEEAISFMTLLLDLDPRRRISAHTALGHSFFENLDDAKSDHADPQTEDV